MISVVVLTKNEEHNIERCLKSVSFAEEIIIIDDFSEDKTIEIARKFKAQIVQNNLNNDFAQQRNFGMQKAQGDWILCIDADEEVSPELAKEIQIATQNNEIAAYFIRRKDFFWGNTLKYGEVSKVYNEGLLRLVQRNAGTWRGKVHEAFQTKGKTAILPSFLNHYPHQTVKEFIQSVNMYSTLRAKELHNAGKKAVVFELIAYPCGKFIWTYFLKLGFIDGAAGFVYAFFMSFHSFLVRAKLYQYAHIDNNPNIITS